MFTRRDLLRTAVTAVPCAMRGAPGGSVIHGVHVGMQTYIFSVNTALPRERMAQAALQTLRTTGIGECDVLASLIEPADLWARARSGDRVTGSKALADWRKTAPLDHYRDWRRRFNDAGADIFGMSGFAASTPDQLQRLFEIADVLGARVITSGMTVETARALAATADRGSVMIGLQARPDVKNTDPNVLSTPDVYAHALDLSKNYRLSLDIGDAVGGGWDIGEFVRAHIRRTAILYLKDRRRDNTSVPFGEGGTPVADILRFVRDGGYQARCLIDCDYRTDDREADVRRSFEFVKAALA